MLFRAGAALGMVSGAGSDGAVCLRCSMSSSAVGWVVDVAKMDNAPPVSGGGADLGSGSGV